MAVSVEILTNAKIVLDTFDMVNLVQSVVINGDAQMVEITGMGDTSRRFVKSIRNFTDDITFKDDFVDNGLNEKLDTLWRQAASCALTVLKNRASAIGVTNPEWRGNVFVTTLSLFNASFGEASGGTLRLQGDGDVTRNVT
jgi:hypothetical protein